MINFIKGQVIGSTNQTVTISLGQLGISFELFVPNSEMISIGKEINFYTYMHWNQENGPSLFGFLTENEKKIFLLVISCSGIGPKIALAVLSQMQPNEFITAIQNQDVKALSSINGIGAKKAEQMIVYLKHKISGLLESGFDIESSENLKNIKNISDVLNSLNYSRQEIANALEYVKNQSAQKEFTFDQMLRQALSYLSKRI